MVNIKSENDIHADTFMRYFLSGDTLGDTSQSFFSTNFAYPILRSQNKMYTFLIKKNPEGGGYNWKIISTRPTNFKIIRIWDTDFNPVRAIGSKKSCTPPPPSEVPFEKKPCTKYILQGLAS